MVDQDPTGNRGCRMWEAFVKHAEGWHVFVTGLLVNEEAGRAAHRARSCPSRATKLVGSTIWIQLHTGHWWPASVVGFDAQVNQHWLKCGK
ncbi:hypothetical protein ABBQ38_004452 [Trebouxia sp. C0009 RCD-2024]